MIVWIIEEKPAGKTASWNPYWGDPPMMVWQTRDKARTKAKELRDYDEEGTKYRVVQYSSNKGKQ